MAQQADTPMQPGQGVATNHFQPEQLVFEFNHAHQANEAQDRQLKGFESAKRYYHVGRGFVSYDVVTHTLCIQH